MMCSTGFELDLSVGNETVGGRLISLYSASRGMLGASAVQSPPEDSSKKYLYFGLFKLNLSSPDQPHFIFYTACRLYGTF